MMNTREKAAFLLGFGAGVGHHLSTNEKREMVPHLKTAQEIVDGPPTMSGTSPAKAMRRYVVRLMLKWLATRENVEP